MRHRYPATLVKEYAWCPTAAWLAANLGVTPPPTPRMLEGIEADRRALEEIRRLYPDAKPLPPLHSKRYPLTATPDAYSPSTRTLIEAKKVAGIAKRLYRVQLLVYAYIAEENNIKVDKAVLLNLEDGKRIEIEIDAAALQTAEKIIKATLETIKRPTPPPTTQPQQKCTACRWRRYCPNTP